ncbi:hypothetical protein Q1W73_12820 [Asticcacaulis sp. ZE23SCel15]|uniref:lysozyme inhibitor LprI family protein n=1 Tax=Asticcacaulis sp. ZE23SCel15 TaxID=3059027 RepID=UPI00265FB092|nr:hypothetical protein [Asticcacaulis sp. ZE23SCel15]WKL56563.1 hypothetical protein Q1W73_12820 [Asticcacaulis sp. ZE23SCel15]
MLRPLVCAAFLIAMPVASGALAQPTDAVTTLRFNPGQSSQDIRGTVVGYQGAVYAVNARGGDRADIRLQGPGNVSLYYNVISPSGDTLFNGSISGDRFTGTLKETGTYSIQVYLMRNDARRGKRADFKLSVRLDSNGAVPGPITRPPHGYGPSFDCRKAGGVVEATICRNTSLSELDARLAFVYKDALAGASPNRKIIIQRDQKIWLTNRNACTGRKNVSSCLDKAYRSRIGMLEPKR